MSKFIKRLKLTLMAGIGLSSFVSMNAALELPSLFSDHMVLQRGVEVPVWGTADRGMLVEVAFGNHTVQVEVDETGAWEACLSPLSVGEADTLSIRLLNGESEVSALEYKDVLVGDVWVASGQSNMEWTMSNDARKDEFIPKADYPEIRFFKVPQTTSAKPQNDTDAQWALVSPDSVGGFSAVAYYFARNIHREEGIPVGVLESAWGGTPIEPWMSRQAILSIEETRERYESLESELTQEKIEENQSMVDRYWELVDEDYHGLEAGVGALDYDDSEWERMEMPQMLPLPDGAQQAIAWLRKSFVFPEGVETDSWELQLGKPSVVYSVYLNGNCVAKKIWHTQVPHHFELKPEWLLEGENQIAIRMLCMWNLGGFDPEGDSFALVSEDGAVEQSLEGEWKYSFGVDPELPKFQNYQSYPTTLFNGMIHPLIPYGIKGFIWYQGESNVGQEQVYAKAFPAMIQDWRNHWGSQLPFLYVELPNYADPGSDPVYVSWARQREAQAEALKLRQVGRACIIEQGNPKDIHPQNKFQVGYRLSLVARELAYGESVISTGPEIASWCVKNGKVHVSYDLHGSTLASETPDALTGFELAGKDGVFHPAKARIEGDQVVVSSKFVEEPKELRYAFSNSPVTTLFNAEGLPAVPYRSDSF